jgi:hypothetical protein
MPVPDFSPGEVLTAAAMDSIGLWLVKTQTVGTGASSIVVTNAFSSTYENYLITLTGGTLAADANITMQLGPSSISGYNTSYYAGVSRATETGATSNLNTNNAASWGQIGLGRANGVIVSCTLFGPNLNRRTWMRQDYVEIGSSGGWGAGGGSHQTVGQFTDFTLSAAFAFNGGTVRVYGYRN